MMLKRVVHAEAPVRNPALWIRKKELRFRAEGNQVLRATTVANENGDAGIATMIGDEDAHTRIRSKVGGGGNLLIATSRSVG